MNKTLRLFVSAVVVSFISISANATLTHQYTFNDGTVDDSMGSANGTLMNGATVSGGQLVLPTGMDAYASLPGPTIGINAYTAATFEIWFTSSSANTSYTMAMMLGRSFDVNIDGTSNGGPFPDGDTWRGIAYVMIQPTRNAGPAAGRVAITATSFEDEAGVNNATQINDDMQHYVAVTVDASDITFYLDGGLVGSAALGAISLADVSPDLAYLGRSNYPDPYFKGSINEFSVWDNVLSPAEISANFGAGPVIPEPSTFALFALGLGGLLAFRHRSA